MAAAVAVMVVGVGMLGVTCGITFVTQSCVVTTDSRQQRHCLERYRLKHEAGRANGHAHDCSCFMILRNCSLFAKQVA